ncbi:MAG: hypothetical protein J6C56_03560 [Alistipes sp.]|nr:hypothetical protein [Alistipes sp.]
MKRLLITGLAVVSLVGCADEAPKIKINELNPTNEAYIMSDSLARGIVEASNYEEFNRARKSIEEYEEAMRTQIGGEAYLIFLEECNYFMEEI